MKKLLVILLLASCKNHKTTISNTNTTSVDSILVKVQENQTIAEQASKKGDSAVTGKIEHTAQKIEHLETQVEQLKEENHELKVKLDDATDDGHPYSGLPVSPN